MEVTGLPPRLVALISGFLPAPIDTRLLQAAVGSGPAVEPGWRAWLDAVGDPVRALGTDPRHIKALVPLLARNLDAHGVAVTTTFRTYARAAYLTETLRMSAFLRHAGVVLDLFTEHGVPHVVLKGAALAESVYGDPALRHAHDFDILVAESHLNVAADLLVREGFSAPRAMGADHHHLPPLSNGAGFTVEIHRRFRTQYPALRSDEILSRSRVAPVAGRPARVPSLADAFVQLAVHATACNATNLRWACDAAIVARQMTDDDWRRVGAIAADSGVALPVALVVGFLIANLQTTVPAEAQAGLLNAADRTSRSGLSAAVYGARAALPLDFRGIMSMNGGWPARLAQLTWRLVPPPRHLIWMRGLPSPWTVPLQYPLRLLQAARRPAAQIVSRMML